jgi:hypothetical protein
MAPPAVQHTASASALSNFRIPRLPPGQAAATAAQEPAVASGSRSHFAQAPSTSSGASGGKRSRSGHKRGRGNNNKRKKSETRSGSSGHGFQPSQNQPAPSGRQAPPRNIAGYEVLGSFEGSWLTEPSKRLLSEAVMNKRRAIQQYIDGVNPGVPFIPDDQVFETVMYFSRWMQNFCFTTPRLRHSLAARDLPTNPREALIPFDVNVGLLQLHDWQTMIGQNGWLKTLVTWLRSSMFFSSPRKPTSSRFIFIFMNNSQVLDLVAEGESIQNCEASFLTKAAENLVLMLEWLSAQLGCHVIFGGMSVNATLPGCHPGAFVSALDAVITNQRNSVPGLKGVYCWDIATCAFPEPTGRSDGETVHGFVYKEFLTVFQKLFAYAIAHVDQHPDETQQRWDGDSSRT